MFSLVHLIVKKILENMFLKPPGWNNNEEKHNTVIKNSVCGAFVQISSPLFTDVLTQVGYLNSLHLSPHICKWKCY